MEWISPLVLYSAFKHPIFRNAALWLIIYFGLTDDLDITASVEYFGPLQAVFALLLSRTF